MYVFSQQINVIKISADLLHKRLIVLEKKKRKEKKAKKKQEKKKQKKSSRESRISEDIAE